MKSTKTFISNFKEGICIKGFFICREKINKTTRLGDPYIDLVLEDKTGVIRGKVWSYVDSLNKLIIKDKAVAVKGTIIKYNNINEINISYINTVSYDLYNLYGFNKNNLIKTVNMNIDKMNQFLYETINNTNIPYRQILKSIIDDNILFLKKIPSINVAYSKSGGWLFEVISTLKLNNKICSLYKELNIDLIISGIILKKIGLISYFNNDFTYSINETAENININLLSINVITKYFDKSNEDIKLNIQKMILDDKNDFNVRYVNALYNFNNYVQHVK